VSASANPKIIRTIMLTLGTYMLARYLFPEHINSEQINDSDEEANKTIPIIRDPDPVELKLRDPIKIPNFKPIVKIRGGSFKETVKKVAKQVSKRLLSDRAIRIAGIALVMGVAYNEFSDKVIIALMKNAYVLRAIPGLNFSKKFLKILNRTNELQEQLSVEEIIAVIRDSDLSLKDKMLLFQYQLKMFLTSLTKINRKHRYMILASLLILLVGNNSGFFLLMLNVMREGNNSVEIDQKTIDKFIIKMYRDFNAPLPEELGHLYDLDL
jgi:hypothetical protein